MKTVLNINWSHCCIRRQSLASTNLSEELKLVLVEKVKLVNFIKARSINSKRFKASREDFMDPRSTLLFHKEVRWLSRGKILTRLFELRHEVGIFLEKLSFSINF